MCFVFFCKNRCESSDFLLCLKFIFWYLQFVIIYSAMKLYLARKYFMKLFWFEFKRIWKTQTKSMFWNRISDLFWKWFAVSKNTYYDLYKTNGDIRQSIRKIAWSVSRNGIYLEDNKNQIVDDPQALEQVQSYFKSPTFLKFKTEVFKNYLLSGECYIAPLVNLEWSVAWFHVIDSRAVTKITDGRWNITAFHLNTTDGKQRVCKPDELAFFKLEDDIDNSTNWLPLLSGVVYDALADLEASKTNLALYRNSAIPSALLILDGEMSEEEMQIAKEMFEAQFRWSENQHKSMIAGWIKDVKTLSITPRDMEFINQRHMTTEKISALFGVPKSILWYVDAVNYSNARELKKEFLEGTIRPFEKDFEDMMNVLMKMFVPEIWKKYRIKCDGEQLEEQQERFEWQRKDIQAWILTINEVRVDRGLEKVNDENADKLLISKNVSLLEDIALDAVLSPDET